MILLNLILSQLKQKPILIIVGILIIISSLNGIKDGWQQFKQYIVVKELKAKGLELVKKEQIVLKQINEIDSVIIEQKVNIQKNDYQVYKKSKKINVVDSVSVITADSLLSKWKL